MRVGGFGGADGLAAFLRDEGITHVVDATHPFAGTITANAARAAAADAACRCSCCAVPSGQADPSWQGVADIHAAAEAVRALAGRGRVPHHGPP